MGKSFAKCKSRRRLIGVEVLGHGFRPRARSDTGEMGEMGGVQSGLHGTRGGQTREAGEGDGGDFGGAERPAAVGGGVEDALGIFEP